MEIKLVATVNETREAWRQTIDHTQSSQTINPINHL